MMTCRRIPRWICRALDDARPPDHCLDRRPPALPVPSETPRTHGLLPGLLDDEQLYQQGRALALGGHYEEALGALAAV
jgi:hypothetical protein